MCYLIIVSNRGPYSFSKHFLTGAEACLKKGTRPKGISFGEGGLVQAMAARGRLERLSPLLPTSSFGPTCLSV